MKGIIKLLTAMLACLLLGPVQTAGAGEWTPEMVAEVKAQAEAGDADAQFNLGLTYYHGQGVRQDYAEARRWYEKAVAQGHPQAQLNLGVMYSQGQGVRQNLVEARRLYEMAASQGNAQAQFNLGVMYDNGIGVRQDKRTAKEWFGRACDNGDQDGCNHYRRLNEAGF